MIPRYSANGSMRHDPNGTYVAASDYDQAMADLTDLGRFAIDQMKAADRGEITHEGAIASVAGLARLKYGI